MSNILTDHNYKVMRAMWTAMDQTYGPTEPNFELQPIDNGGGGRTQPFTPPSGYKIIGSAISEVTGKVTIYQSLNEPDENGVTTSSILVVPTGTNGWGDASGWLTNFQDGGRSTWDSPLSPKTLSSLQGDTVQDAVFNKLNALLAATPNSTITLGGDSRGGAIAQFAINDLLLNKTDTFFIKRYPSLSAITNNKLALVTHCSPGIEQFLKAGEYNPSLYEDVTVNHTATRVIYGTTDHPETHHEFISEIGGNYADGKGLTYYDVRKDTAGSTEWVMYAHRLTEAGWDFFKQNTFANNGDDGFALITADPSPSIIRTQRPLPDALSIGIVLSALNQKGDISLPETVVRGLSAVSCTLAMSPLTALNKLMKGELTFVESLIALGVAYTPIWGAATYACVASVASNAARITENLPGPSGGVVSTDAIRESARAGIPRTGLMGSDVKRLANGAAYVYDGYLDGSFDTFSFSNNIHEQVSVSASGEVWGKLENIRWGVPLDGYAYLVLGPDKDTIFCPANTVISEDWTSQCIVATYLTRATMPDGSDSPTENKATLTVKPTGEMCLNLGDARVTDITAVRSGKNLIVSCVSTGLTQEFTDWYSLDGTGVVNTSLKITSSLTSDTLTVADLTTLGLTVSGTSSDDTIEGLAGYANVFIGKKGNDHLIGKNGVDTYVFSPGDGQDTIDTGGGSDVISLTNGLSLSAAIVRQVGANIQLDFGQGNALQTPMPNAGLNVKVRDSNDVIHSPTEILNAISEIVGTTENETLTSFGNVTKLVGAAGDDTLQGSTRSEQLDGGADKDTLVGGGGQDTYLGGSGNDTLNAQVPNAGSIFVLDSTSDADTLILTNTQANKQDVLKVTGNKTANDLTFSVQTINDGIGSSTSDLLISIKNSNASILIQNFMNGDAPGISMIDKILFDDNSSMSKADILAKISSAILMGTNNNDSSLVATGNIRQVFGLGGNDLITGGVFDEYLNGGDGSDTIDGGDGQDTLVGGLGNDVLGGAGYSKDSGYFNYWSGYSYQTFYPSKGNNYTGGQGADTLRGTCMADTYIFNKGDGQDTIYETELTGQPANQTDVLKFGAGIAPTDVQVSRFNNNLILSLANSTDNVTFVNWYDANAITTTKNQVEQVQFADGTVWTSAALTLQGLTVIGTAQNEVINGVTYMPNNIDGAGGDDTLYGGIANDSLSGNTGNDVVYGGNGGDDTLRGDAGNDTLYGVNGNDVLYGDDGNDTLDGGDGADTLYGGMGNDTLGVSQSQDIGYYNKWNGTSSVTFYPSAGNTYQGDTGNDMIWGSCMADVYIFNKGDGQDTIRENELTGQPSNQTDILKFGAGIAPTDVQVSRFNNNLILSVANSTDNVTFVNWYDSSAVTTIKNQVEQVQFADGTTWTSTDLTLQGLTVLGTAQNDVINGITRMPNSIDGAGGDDTLNGGIANDSLMGNTGNDVLYGGSGDDTLYGDDGNDTLDGGDGADTHYGGAGNDTLGGSQTQDTGYYNKWNGISSVTFYPSAGNTYQGDTGNDTIWGSCMADTYLFNNGDGQDTIRENELTGQPAGQVDVLKFGAGITPTDVQVSRFNNNLILSVANSTDNVTFVNWYDSSDVTATKNQVEQVQFADGTVWTSAALTLQGLTVIGTAQNEVINGVTYMPNNIDGAGGDDTVNGGISNDSLMGNTGNDVLRGNGGEDTLFGDTGNDTLYGENGNDVIYGGDGNDNLDGGDGADTHYGGAGNDTLGGSQTQDTGYYNKWNGISSVTFYPSAGNTYHGDTGNDTILGSCMADTYIFNKGDGLDAIYETELTGQPAGQVDVLKFGPNISASEVTVGRQSNHLTLTLANSTDKIMVINWFDNTLSTTKNQIEQIQFNDGTVWNNSNLTQIGLNYVGTSGADNISGVALMPNTIRGGGGNDSITGGISDDTYLFEWGDAADLIYDAGGSDTIQFLSGINPADLHLQKTNNDLLINVGTGGGSIRVSNWFVNTNAQVETFKFADGSTYTPNSFAIAGV